MEQKKSHKGLIASIIIIVVVCGAGTWIWHSLHSESKNIDVDGYTPSEEFKPAFEALNTKPEPKYDIEETVRILNGMEAAQYQSTDFFAFLEYMAKQDYSRVPADVLETKKKLFPILQKMFELQQQYDDLDDIWMLARSATSGATNFAENISPIGLLSAIFTGNPADAGGVGIGLNEAKSAAFEQYEKDKKLKESLKKEIDQIRLSYIEYLSDYAPIYFKYMNEWDALCLERDKAYLDIYSGRTTDAYNSASKVLDKYPTNREAMLLKALSLIQMAGPENKPEFSDIQAPALQTDSVPQSEAKHEEHLSQALAILDNYTELYPNRSAPALVLKGLISLKEGNIQKAMSSFDQSSAEYPRQAAALTDMLDSYKNRSYLNRSSEGKYLLKLYRSTMEGYGMFSPNLIKARYYADNGNHDKSKEEIFNHFYRRGNQGVYDCLLSDMQYCEENMYSIFKQLLMEQSFIDVSVEPTTDWLVSKNDDEVKVIINNRSDVDLENVRIFLCLHYTDMYTDEYDVVKCPSINIIRHHDKTEVGVVKLNYEDKKYNDITRIRAIAMTDDKICWIDNVDYKYVHAYEASRKNTNADKQEQNRRKAFLDHFNVDSQSLLSAITTGIRIYGDIKRGDKSLWDNVTGVFTSGGKLEVELPRILTLIDPVFSLHQLGDKDNALRPKEDYLAGSNIRLKFDYKPREGETIPLYIYSDYVSFCITLNFKDGKASVADIKIVN
mgnify:CR=1 FL=1